MAEVDVLNAGVGAELCFPEIASEAPVFAVLSLAVDEESKTVLEVKRVVLGTFALFEESASHSFESELVELVERR
jgi:hypothetical protein